MLGRRPDTTGKNKKYAKENVITGQKCSLIPMSHEPQRGKDMRPGRAEQNKNAMKSFVFSETYVMHTFSKLQRAFKPLIIDLKDVFKTQGKVKFAVSAQILIHGVKNWVFSSYVVPRILPMFCCSQMGEAGRRRNTNIWTERGLEKKRGWSRLKHHVNASEVSVK